MLRFGGSLLAGVLAMSVLGGCGGEPADARADDVSPDLMVVGDSISAHWRYDATGAGLKAKAWWAYVAEAAGVDARSVRVDAIPGTGMLATGPANRHATKRLDGLGEACGDDTPGHPSHSFSARLDRISLTHPPRVLIVEGGRNDFKKCVDGVTQLSTVAESGAAIEGYLSALAARVDRAGMAPDRVFVVTPWGPAFAKEREEIRPLVESAARAHGFQWIPTPVIPPADTLDRTHPDATGTAWLARQIEQQSDVVARLRR